MCLIAVALQPHPGYQWVLAANRDEFHNRASAPAAFWPDARSIFGGRDLVQGGSWLALSLRGRCAAITNVRRMTPPDPRAPSRGLLVTQFLHSDLSADEFARQLQRRAQAYSGFNLLLFDGREMVYAGNHPQFTSQILPPGLHAVSNAALDTPWPKLLRLKSGLAAWTQRRSTDTAPLLELLADDRAAADSELPDTGVGAQLERFLSPPFIRGEHYGTRCSTVIALGADGALRFIERRYGPNGVAAGETVQNLRMQV